jgi:hypothetical protein
MGVLNRPIFAVSPKVSVLPCQLLLTSLSFTP